MISSEAPSASSWPLFVVARAVAARLPIRRRSRRRRRVGPVGKASSHRRTPDEIGHGAADAVAVRLTMIVRRTT